MAQPQNRMQYSNARTHTHTHAYNSLTAFFTESNCYFWGRTCACCRCAHANAHCCCCCCCLHLLHRPKANIERVHKNTNPPELGEEHTTTTTTTAAAAAAKKVCMESMYVNVQCINTRCDIFMCICVTCIYTIIHQIEPKRSAENSSVIVCHDYHKIPRGASKPSGSVNFASTSYRSVATSARDNCLYIFQGFSFNRCKVCCN